MLQLILFLAIMLTLVNSLFRRLYATPASPELRTKVQAAIASPVFVASKLYCPFCARTKETLAAAGAKAEVWELDQMEEGGAVQSLLKELTGQSTVPNVFINGKHIGGNSDLEKLKGERLRELLKQ